MKYRECPPEEAMVWFHRCPGAKEEAQTHAPPPNGGGGEGKVSPVCKSFGVVLGMQSLKRFRSNSQIDQPSNFR